MRDDSKDSGTTWSPAAPPGSPAPRMNSNRTLDVRSWLPTKDQTLVLVIGLLIVSQAVTFVKLRNTAKPLVMTVGVREMTQSYLAKLARTNISPQEAAIRTELFLSVSQEVLKHVSAKKGVVVLARECVLAGEHGDATLEVARKVEGDLDKASQNLAALSKAQGAATAMAAASPAPAIGAKP